MAVNKKTKTSGSKRREDTEIPPLEILFNGLFYFSFPDGEDPDDPSRRRFGKVGVLSTREDHLPCITFEIEGRRPKLLTLPFPLARTLPRKIVIDKIEGGSSGVTILGADQTSGWGTPDDRHNRDTNPTYFNWIIDFEGRELHRRNFDEKPSTLLPKLKFLTGEFSTGKVSEIEYYKIHKGIIEPFGYVAETMKVTIPLRGMERVRLTMGERHRLLPRSLRKITLDNLPEPEMQEVLNQRAGKKPLRQGNAAVHREVGMLTHNDLSHPDHSQIYYNDLLDIENDTDRFHFLPELDPTSTKSKERRNVPFICFGGGGSRNPRAE